MTRFKSQAWIGLLMASLLAIVFHFRCPQGTYLRVMFRPEPNELALLWERGATLETTRWGFTIKADEAALNGLLELCRYHQTAEDVISQNLANINTVKTADGTPYRRRDVRLTEQGPRVTVSEEDYKWVYDPTRSNAEHEGKHAGYVAMPNINATVEATNLRCHDRYLTVYHRVLAKLEALDPHLVIPPYSGSINDSSALTNLPHDPDEVPGDETHTTTVEEMLNAQTPR